MVQLHISPVTRTTHLRPSSQQSKLRYTMSASEIQYTASGASGGSSRLVSVLLHYSREQGVVAERNGVDVKEEVAIEHEVKEMDIIGKRREEEVSDHEIEE